MEFIQYLVKIDAIFYFYSILMEEAQPQLQKNTSQSKFSNLSQASNQLQDESVPSIGSGPSVGSLPELLPAATCAPHPFTLLKSSNNCQIHRVASVPSEGIYKTVLGFIQELINNPILLTDILSTFQLIEAEPSQQSIKVLPTRQINRREPLKTSLNELPLGEEERRKGKKVNFGEEKECISIKVIRNSSSRPQLDSHKENISMNRFIPTHLECFVLQEVESAENLDEGPEDKRKRDIEVEMNADEPQFKGISIVMSDEQGREGKDQDSWSSYSEVSLKDLILPTLKLNEKLIQEILDCPSPFLATLSLCLLFKFLQRSHFNAGIGQIGWLLGVATMVAYKVFFDQTIQGLVQYYSRVLGMRGEEIRQLERWFLSGLNYEVVVSNRQYLEVMLRLLPNSPSR